MEKTTCRLRPIVSSCNKYLTCGICRGYLIDATSNANCHHSFCLSCIRGHFDQTKFCPVCKKLNNTDTLIMDLRHDRLLQTIVYKIVPNLFRSEIQRRMDFVDSLADGPGPSGDSWRRNQTRSMRLPRNIYSGAERISLCLVPRDSIPFEVVDSEDEEPEMNSKNCAIHQNRRQKASRQYRYLLCPVALTIGHLKKYIRFKYDVDETFEVDIFHSEDNTLLNEYSLMDVAYIYSKVKVAEITLYYVVFDTTECKTFYSQESECNNNSFVASSRNPKRTRDMEGTVDINSDLLTSAKIHQASSSLRFKKSRHLSPSVTEGRFEPNGSMEPPRCDDAQGNQPGKDSHVDEKNQDGRCVSANDATFFFAGNCDIITHVAQDYGNTTTPELLLSDTTTPVDDCSKTNGSLGNNPGMKGHETGDMMELHCAQKSCSGHVQMAPEYNNFSDATNCTDLLYADGHNVQIANYFDERGNTRHWLTDAHGGVIKDVGAILADDAFPASETEDPGKDSDAEIDTEIRRIAANVAISDENSMTDYGLNEESDSALPSPYQEPSSTTIGCGEEELPGSIMDSIAISQLFAPPLATAENVGISVENLLIQNGPAAFEYLVSSECRSQTAALRLGNMTLAGHELSKWADYVDQMQRLSDSGFRIGPTTPGTFPTQKNNSAFPVYSAYSNVAQHVPGQRVLSSGSIVEGFSTDEISQLNTVYHSSDDFLGASLVCGPSIVVDAASSESLCVSVDHSAPMFSCCGSSGTGTLGNETVDENHRNISVSNSRNETDTSPETPKEYGVNAFTPNEVQCDSNDLCRSSEAIAPGHLVEETGIDGKKSDIESAANRSYDELTGSAPEYPDVNPLSDSFNRDVATKIDSNVLPSALSTLDQFTSLAEDKASEYGSTQELLPIVPTPSEPPPVAAATETCDSRERSTITNVVGDQVKATKPVFSNTVLNGCYDWAAKNSYSPSKLSTATKTKDVFISALTPSKEIAVCESQSQRTVSNSPVIVNGWTDEAPESVSSTRCKEVTATSSKLLNYDGNINDRDRIDVLQKTPESEISGNRCVKTTRQSVTQPGSKISVGTQTNVDLLGRYFKRRVNPVNSYLCGKGQRNGTMNGRDRPCKSTKNTSSFVTSKITNPGLSQTVSPAGMMTSQAAILLSGHGTPILIPAVSPVTINGKSTILITVPGNFSFPSQNGLRPNMTLIQTRLNCPRSTATGFSTPLVIQHRTPSSQAMVLGRTVGPPLQLLVPSVNSNVPISDVSKDIRTPASTVIPAVTRSGYVCRFGVASNQNAGHVSDSVIGSAPCQVSATAATSISAVLKQNRPSSPIVASSSTISQLTLSVATLPTFVLSSEPLSSLQNQNFSFSNTRPGLEHTFLRRGNVASNSRLHDKNHPTSSQLLPSSAISSASFPASSNSTPSTGLPKLSGARHISISNIPHVGNKFSVSRKDPDQRSSLSSSTKSAVTLSTSSDVQAATLLFSSASSFANSSSTSVNVPRSSSTATSSPGVLTTAASDIRVSFQFDAKSGNYSLSQGQRIEGAPVSLIRAILERNLIYPYDTERPLSNDTNHSSRCSAVENASGKQKLCGEVHCTTGNVFAMCVSDIPSSDNIVTETSKSSHSSKCSDKMLETREIRRHNETETQEVGRTMSCGEAAKERCANRLSSPDLNSDAKCAIKNANGVPHSSGVVTRSQRSGASTGRPNEDARCPAVSSSLASPPSPPGAILRRRSAAEANIKGTPGGLATKKRRRNSSDTAVNSSSLKFQESENCDSANPTQPTVLTKHSDIGSNRCPAVSESGNSVRRSTSQNPGVLVKPPPAIPGIFSKSATCSEGATSPSSTAVGSCGQLPENGRQPTPSTSTTGAVSAVNKNGDRPSTGLGNRVDTGGSSPDGASKPGWASMAVQTRSGMVALPKKVYTYFGSAVSHEHIAAREKSSADGPRAQSKDDQATENGRTVAEECLDQAACYLRPNDEDLGTQSTAPPINQLRRMCSYIQNGRHGKASPTVETELLPPRLSPFT